MLYNTPADLGAFDRYYRDVHVPLAKKLPGLRRYTTSKGVSAGRGEGCYLVAELDWDDMPAVQQAFASPEGKAAAEDVPKFATGGSQTLIYEFEDA